MFGGATGDTGKYVITADTYTLDLTKSIWKKIDGKCTHCDPYQEEE